MVRMVHVDITEDLQPDALHAALAGHVSTVSPSVALGSIAALGLTDDEKSDLLHEVIRNVELPSPLRAAATRLLMRRAGLDAVPALIEVLRSGDGRLPAAAAAALGQVGSPSNLAALEQARVGATDDLTRRKAAF